MQPVRRGDIWWVTFDSSVGGEIRKTRPAVIISNNAANLALNRVVIIPLSTRVEKVFPGETLVTIAGKKSKAIADQITTASKTRLRTRIERLTPADLKAVEDVIMLHLGIRRV